jgi:hydrogenase/urease accessory protein HupE
MTTGLGPVYDGLSHFVLTPEDLLPAVALALLAGQRGVRAGRLVLFALPVSWLAGGLLGLALPALHAAPWLAAIGFVALGGLVAAEARIGPAGVAGLAAALGLVHGAGNGAAMAAARLGGLGLVGIVVALFVVVALTAARVASLRAAWARLAVRVAGSWIVAVGLLLLGWSLRGAG